MFRKHHKTIRSILTATVLLALAVMSVSPAAAVDVGNDEINFIGVRYDYPSPGQSTWYYEVKSQAVTGSGPAISHVLFELNLECLQVLDAGTWDGTDQDNLTSGGGNPVLGPDGSTGYIGLKFDEGFDDGETRYYYFTVDNNYAPDENITIVSKGGPGYDTALITGPAASCDFIGPAIDLEKLINDADADEAPGVSLTEGDAFDYNFVVTNTGNVPLGEVIVIDDVLGDVCSFGPLAVGDSYTCSVPASAGEGLHSNLGLAYAYYQGIRVEDTDPAHYTGAPRFIPNPAIDIEKFVNTEDVDAAPGPEVIEGDLVTFTFTITNIGNVPLTNVQVTDSDFALSDCPPSGSGPTLNPGESFSCTHTVLAITGQHTNTATATGEYDGSTVNDSDPANYFGVPRFIPNPAIDIEKLVNGQDADEPIGPIVLLPNTVSFSFIVENTGNVDLSNVVISDNILGVICSFETLVVGQVETCGATADAVEGQHVNTGTATGEYGGSPVSDTDPGHYYGKKPFESKPGIDIEKLVNGIDADTAAEGPVVPVGSTVTFTYKVVNTGGITLNNVIVADNKLGVICNIPKLDPGKFQICTKTSTAILGSYSNIGKTAGFYGSPTTGQFKAEDTDWAHYTGQ